MLKRLRTAHPILYCILSEVLFLGSMVVFSLLATIGLAAAGADFDTMDGYLFGSVLEAVGLAVALLLLSRTRCFSSGTQPLERWLLAARTRRCCRCPAS